MGKTGLTDALAKKKQSHTGKAKEEAEQAATSSQSADLTRLTSYRRTCTSGSRSSAKPRDAP